MNRQFKRNSNITLAVMLPVLLAGLACNDSTYENSRTIGRAMVSDEEIERVFNLLPQMGEPHDPVAFQKIADQYPEVFAEQERRNETEAAIRNNDLVLLRKNISENPEYLNKLFAGNPLIQQAAQCGNLEACKILISAGADIGKLSISRTYYVSKGSITNTTGDCTTVCQTRSRYQSGLFDV